MKYLVTTAVCAFFFFGMADKTLACDPIGCFLAGKDQNVVALVEVTSLDYQDAIVRPYYVFPLNVANLGNSLTVSKFLIDRETSPGDRYLVSLQCEKNVCAIAWGAWAVTGEDLESTKLKEIRFGDDAIIQTYISSGGTLTDYYSIGNTTYLKTPSAGDIEIYPNGPAVFPGPFLLPAQTQWKWIALGVLTVLVIIGIILFKRKKPL